MIDIVTGVGPSMETDQAVPPPPPPPPHRRPRVREVSSRFMSPAPAVSSSTPSDLHLLQPIKSPLPKHGISTPIPETRQHRLKSLERRKRRQEDKEGLLTCCAHESIPETTRSLDTPLGSRNKPPGPIIRKQQRAMKLFKENLDGRGEEHSDAPLQSKVGVSSRPETQTVPTSCADRMIASRFRSIQHQTKVREISLSVGTTDASKLLLSSGLSSSSPSFPNLMNNIQNEVSRNPSHGATPSTDDKLLVTQCLKKVRLPSSDEDLGTADSILIRPNTCTSSPLSIQSSRTRPLPDTRSSMPEGGDMLSSRTLGIAQPNNRNVGNCQASKLSSASPCSRSLNLPLSSCDNSITHSFKNGERTSNMSSFSLPPQPTCTRLGVDSRKGRKPFNSHEQVHSLKLLQNHYLQWRFANAKAKASMRAQQNETESKLYSIGLDIADLRDSVKRKRIEVEVLRRTMALVTIAEAQMPYLVEWSALEDDYSNSLSGSIHALVNSSLRLPVSGNIQVDIKQIAEALQSALKTMEMIGALAERFMPKAEEMDTLISDLARVIGGERAIVEECSDLLFKTYKSQVEDCSLRGHLMQLECSKKLLQP